jgi:hypothetical protein
LLLFAAAATAAVDAAAVAAAVVIVVHHLCHYLEELGRNLHLSFHHLLHTGGTSSLLLPMLLRAQRGCICGLE